MKNVNNVHIPVQQFLKYLPVMSTENQYRMTGLRALAHETAYSHKFALFLPELGWLARARTES